MQSLEKRKENEFLCKKKKILYSYLKFIIPIIRPNDVLKVIKDQIDIVQTICDYGKFVSTKAPYIKYCSGGKIAGNVREISSTKKRTLI